MRKKWEKKSIITIKLAIDNCTLFRQKMFTYKVDFSIGGHALLISICIEFTPLG